MVLDINQDNCSVLFPQHLRRVEMTYNEFPEKEASQFLEKCVS